MSRCKEKMCTVYTKEQQEILRANPNVASINGNRLILTYETRIRMYDVWEKNPCCQTIREFLQENGIDPQIVGKWFISSTNVKFARMGRPRKYCPKKKVTYNEKTLQKVKGHPYVTEATSNKIIFHPALYRDARFMVLHDYTVEEILDVFDLPTESVPEHDHLNFLFKCEYADDVEHSMLGENDDQKRWYLQIQVKRATELKRIVEQGFEMVQKTLKESSVLQRKKICQWIRDDVPKQERGEFSIRGILSKVGISKSNYYSLLADESVEAKVAAKAAAEQKDMEDIRKVIEYKGYPKGSRQVYMQMEKITGRRMCRGKIMVLMRKMGCTSKIRKAKNSRKAARERLQKYVKPNLVKRRFRLHRPGEVYLTDVTYFRYGRGLKKLAYGSACIDSVTGRLYSFDISKCNNLNLVLTTLRNIPPVDAETELKPIMHSDQGSVYLSDEFQELVTELGFQESMSKRGNCWDNAPQESFFGHFKDECDYRSTRDIEELCEMVADYSVYFNNDRCQWNRNQMTPLQFEAYLNSMSEEEFQKWQEVEEVRYQAMKQRAKEKAIERAKTMGV